jgi:uncharacterized protein YndB with AHSA1/START domain
VDGRDSGTATASDVELVITRVFDAPRELVWKAWTDPEQMKKWSAPKGFTIPISEGELRPGGAWRSMMVSPDGMELKLGGVYREIVEPERLVFTHAWTSPTQSRETLCTVTLVERGNKTEMTFRQTGFASTDARDSHNDGWSQCFDRLEDLLASK